MSSQPDLHLDWCSYAAAKYAVEHWHYSKTMPVGKMVKLGIWEQGRFIGAIIFGLGGGGAGDGRRYRLARNFQVAELERIALQEHQTPVSRLVSIAVGLLRKQSPGLRMVVSYADPRQGHVGAIYQAGNWIYAGLSPADWEIVWPSGRVAHSRIAREHVQFGVKKTVDISGGMRRPVPGKYRYLYPLSRELWKHCLAFAQPYPKRPKDSSEPPAIHAGEGGAAPTRTLQTTGVPDGQKA